MQVAEGTPLQLEDTAQQESVRVKYPKHNEEKEGDTIKEVGRGQIMCRW